MDPMRLKAYELAEWRAETLAKIAAWLEPANMGSLKQIARGSWLACFPRGLRRIGGSDGFGSLEEAGNFGRALAKDIKSDIEKRCSALELKITRLEAALEARPNLKYVGVYPEGRTCDENSFVWHANQKTSTPPGNGSASWTLACKHSELGRDRRDAAK